MDVDGAYVIAHGVLPRWGQDADLLGVVALITLLLTPSAAGRKGHQFSVRHIATFWL